MPDNIHALYLIECLIRDDNLFNRRFPTKFDKAEYFRHDGLNYIYDTLSINKLEGADIMSPIDFSRYSNEFKKAWTIYKKWYYEAYLNNANGTLSPLNNSTLRWNSRHFAFGGGFHIYESNFKNREKDTWAKKLLHLDFKIGNCTLADSTNNPH